MTTYTIGIDVGTHSVGCAAVETDTTGHPTRLLSTVSFIHDSGIDPDGHKTSTSRKAASGAARRSRRRLKRQKKRTRALHHFLDSNGIPSQTPKHPDPYRPWYVRAELVDHYIADDTQRAEMLSVAIRHIYNHRGWRNPYSRVTSLYNPTKESDQLAEIRHRINLIAGTDTQPGATIAQIINPVVGTMRLRGKAESTKETKKSRKQRENNPTNQDYLDTLKNLPALSTRLHQSDLAYELTRICQRQKINDGLRKRLIQHVFDMESPKGSFAQRVGKDPLQPTLSRAPKACDAFQTYRIATVIANLRILDGGTPRRLSIEELNHVYNLLVNTSAKNGVTWEDVADSLGIDRGQLRGTATLTADGERAGNTPPVHVTRQRITQAQIPALTMWWESASLNERDTLVEALSNSSEPNWVTDAGHAVDTFLAHLSDDDLADLDTKLTLPAGRAAYSEDTLRRLTRRVLDDGMDLHEARKAEFGVPDGWEPPAPPVGQPTGHPAVDRVLRTVNTWVNAIEKDYGAPQKIVIENARDGFMSEKKTREYNKDNNDRYERNQDLLQKLEEATGKVGFNRRAALYRYEAVTRQKGHCLYCGTPITYTTCEMDHIVPRAGLGSTNTRDNLVAVCHQCNLAKKNFPFATWASMTTIPGVSVTAAIKRVRKWKRDKDQKDTPFKRFKKSVIARLKRTTADEPIDNRSLESVGYMATELRHRLTHRFTDTTVRVYKGVLTAEARKASGIEEYLPFIDGVGKTRTDRRHHAIDAAVITMTTDYVAETLSERINMHDTQRVMHRADQQWREYTGKDAAHRTAWNAWYARMHTLAGLLHTALDDDTIPVITPLRLKLADGKIHEDGIQPLTRLKVSDAMDMRTINNASTPALWCALTRQPDFRWGKGLPHNPDRHIRVHNNYLGPDDEIGVFSRAGDAAGIAVRGGWAKTKRFHHIRVYRIRKPRGRVSYGFIRVYSVDLARHRKDDLFTVDLPPQSLSMRKATTGMRNAIREGRAEYVTWLVTGDELQLSNVDTIGNAHARELAGRYHQPLTCWKIAGFESNSKIAIKPLLVSAEGTKSKDKAMEEVVAGKGWRVSFATLMNTHTPTLIRRNRLGHPTYRPLTATPEA